MKLGFKEPSAINSNILFEYLDNPLAEAPFELKFISAPRKSISSLKASLEIVLVPFPAKLLVRLSTPFLAPSAFGALSIDKL